MKLRRDTSSGCFFGPPAGSRPSDSPAGGLALLDPPIASRRILVKRVFVCDASGQARYNTGMELYISRYTPSTLSWYPTTGLTPALTMADAMPRKKRRELQFAARLAAFRKAHGLTQVQLSERTGISQRAISSYEAQGSYPPADVVASLARGLGVSTDELLGLKAPPKALRQRPEPVPRGLRKKLQQILTLPASDQRAILRLINSLTDKRNGGRR